jgi:hypothetical protein
MRWKPIAWGLLFGLILGAVLLLIHHGIVTRLPPPSPRAFRPLPHAPVASPHAPAPVLGPSTLKTIASAVFFIIGFFLIFSKDDKRKTAGASLMTASATFFLGSQS